MSLADNTCVPCRGGVPSLESEKIKELLGQLEPGWILNDQGHIDWPRLREGPDPTAEDGAAAAGMRLVVSHNTRV